MRHSAVHLARHAILRLESWWEGDGRDVPDQPGTSGGSVFKWCACTRPVLDATGSPVRRQLGASCPRPRQRTQRLAAGPAWSDTGHVFTRPDGHPWHPADVTDAFTAAAAGLPPIRLHDLRYGTATHALAAGIDIKVVQEILGHSSCVITSDTYTSVLDEAKHAAAAAIAAQLDSAPTTRRARPRTPPAC